MGNNDFQGREGPGNQSVGNPIRSIDEEGTSYQQDNKSDAEMEPSGAATPSEGGEGIIDIDDFDDAADDEAEIDISRFAYKPNTSDRDTRSRTQKPTPDEFEDENVDESQVLSHQHQLHLLEQYDKEDVTDVYFKPDKVTKSHFRNLGQGGATIAANNGAGMIRDRLKLLGATEQSDISVNRHIRQRLRAGHLVSLKNVQERSEINKDQNKTQWARLPEQFGTTLVDRMVRGQYADMTAKPHQQHVLNHVGMSTIRNGTYLAKDGERFLKKVQSLLPKESADRPAQRARK